MFDIYFSDKKYLLCNFLKFYVCIIYMNLKKVVGSIFYY